jgi:hypothetical protein
MSESNAPHPPPLFTGEITAVPRVPVFAWAHRNRHYTVPAVLLPLAVVAGVMLAAFRLFAPTVAGSVVAVAMMAFAAPHKWDRTAERWYAVLSTAAAGTWLSLVSLVGMSLILFYVAAGLVAVWGGFWWHHKRPRAKRGDARLTDEWNQWWLWHSRDWNLHGSTVVGVVTRGSMEILDVQLWKGRQHVSQVQDAVRLIESALAGYVRPGQVRADPHPDNASRCLVHLKRQDPLRLPVSWHAGLAISSITETAAIGFTELGDHIKVSLLGNWFIIGRTRSGKSNELSNFLAAITGCGDALVWLVDRKGGRAARPWMPAIDWCATEMDEIAVMFDALIAECEARARDAYTGKEQLDPAPECPAIFLVIDETYRVTSRPAGSGDLAAKLATIASMGSGLAVYVVVCTQHGALDESVQTEQTRGNLHNRMCFAVSEQRHAAFALDNAKIDASKLEQQGSFYYRLGPHGSIAPARGFRFEHDLVREVARQHGAMPRPPLRLYAAAWQPVYDERWARLPQAFWRDAPQTETLQAPGSDSVTAAVAPPARSGDAGIELVARIMRDTVEADIAATPDIPIGNLNIPPDDVLRRDVDRKRARLARALMTAPAAGIAPKQLTDASGLSRSYVMGLLRELTEYGAVARPDQGLYAAAGADVWTAMEDIRQGQARLLAGASSG